MKISWAAPLLVGVLAFAGCGDDASDPTPAPATTGAPSAAASSAATQGGATAAPSSAAAVAVDKAFGSGGLLKPGIAPNDNDRFMAVAFGPDGSYYAAGFTTSGSDQAMMVAKFSPAGALDKAFGKDGVATVNVASGGKTAELARAVVVQANGKILIGGPIEHDTTATGDLAKDTDIAVVRFDATGKLDPTFGKEGIAKVDLGTGKATSTTAFVGDTSWGLGVLPGDKVVAFGSKLTMAAGRTDTDYVLVGLTSAGVLDTGFGTNGSVVVDLKGSVDNPRTVSVQPDGRIVATGYSTIDGVVQPVLIRLSSAGVLDSGFGSGGIATAKILDGVAESYAFGFQADSYVTAGYGRGANATEKVDLISVRFKADGSWDKTYGTDGLFRLDIAKEDDRARNVVVLPDGRVLAVGSGKQTAANIDGMVVLLSKDGKPVTEFGTNGYVITDLGGPADAWFGVAVSPDKKSVILAGYKGIDATSGGNDDAVLARITL